MNGLEILEVCKKQVYDAWKHWRASGEPSDDLAAFVYVTEPAEVHIALGTREKVMGVLDGEGVDFTKHPELTAPANGDTPTPSLGLWVIVALLDDDDTKREVYVTRMIEPLFSGLGAPLGQA
jgi:hypothetical protein